MMKKALGKCGSTEVAPVGGVNDAHPRSGEMELLQRNRCFRLHHRRLNGFPDMLRCCHKGTVPAARNGRVCCGRMLRNSFIAFCSCLSGFAFSQDAPQHRLRVLAVGDQPPFKQEVREGVRYEIAPPADMVPPRTLLIPFPLKQGEEKQKQDMQLRLRLGQPSTPLVMPAPETRRVALNSDHSGKWLDIPLSTGDASLAIVWRKGPKWTAANTIILPDGAASRAEGNLHFSNVSAYPVGLEIEKEKIRLNPGMSYTRKLPSDRMTPLQVSYLLADGTNRLCHSAALEPCRGSYRRLVIYSADGNRPRNPVKVLQLEEPSNAPEPTPTPVTAAANVAPASR